LEIEGTNELQEAHEALDQAVQAAYLFGSPQEKTNLNRLEFLLKLNKLVSAAERSGHKVVGPGLPDFCKGQSKFYSDDCVEFQ
jgi:hypothetical protein